MDWSDGTKGGEGEDGWGGLGKVCARRVNSFTSGGEEMRAATSDGRSMKGRKMSSGSGVKVAGWSAGAGAECGEWKTGE